MSHNTKVGGGVYAISNILTGEQYIGSAIHFSNRRRRHFWLLAKGIHDNPRLQEAYDRDGREAFNFRIIERLDAPEDRDARIQREQFYLDNLKPAYNICLVAGDSTGRPHTPESRAKMSEAQRRRAPVSAETRAKRSENQRRRMADPAYRAMIAAKVSATQKGRKMTDEHRAKVAEAAKNRDHTRLREMAAGQRGKRLSAVHRAKISAAGKGRQFSPEHRAHLSEANRRRFAASKIEGEVAG